LCATLAVAAEPRKPAATEAARPQARADGKAAGGRPDKAAEASAERAAAARGELSELRQRIDALQRKLAGAEGVRNEAGDALRASERAISEARRRLFEIAAERQQVEVEITRLTGEAGLAQGRLERHQARLAALLVRLQAAGDADPLRLALAGETPAEAARLLHYHRYLQRAHAQLIGELRTSLESLRRVSGEQRRKAAALAALEAEATRERARLDGERARQRAVLARVSREIEANRRQIVTLRRDEERLGQLVEQIARVLAERERARARSRDAARAPRPPGGTKMPGPPAPVREPPVADAAPAPPPTGLRSERAPEPATGSGGFAATRGRLALPVTGEIANRFGQPRAEGGLEWRGVTILARPGQEVRSVAPGRVVFADWLRGFGNLLIVDHGDGYMSLYGNNESLLRRVGDAVRGGDPVATVGASGGSARPGVYFELRHQGRPVDPLAWAGVR
jgi:septal ring factor EnvC (AmiA/AmiB activator)